MSDMNFAVNLLPDSNGSRDLGSNQKKWNVYADGGNVLTNEDVVNNLSSTATDKPLPAAQGKALNDKIINLVKYDSLTGMTDSNGIIATSRTTIDVDVIAAWSQYSIINEYINSANKWCFRVESINGSISAGLSVTVNYAYIEK